MKIDRGFTNHFGDNFDNIVYIDFDSIDDMKKYLGELIFENKKDKIVKNIEHKGIFLHRMKDDVDKDYAFRLYRNYDNYKNILHYDDYLVSILQCIQPSVKKSDFPIGIMSINGYVVGQIIIYYEQCETLFNYLRFCDDVEIFKSCCMQIVSIIEELLDNNVFFGDIHSKNFLINSDNEIKIIDFECPYVSFCDEKMYAKILDKLIYMFKYASKYIDFPISYGFSMNEIKECILSLK